MPLVDFKCKNCNHEFFEIVKSTDDKVTCPICEKQEVERVYKGKFYGKGNCGGDCGCCGGCH